MALEVPMMSERFLTATEVECCCCGAASFGIDACSHCHMPTAVSEQISTLQVKPMFIPILGGKGAGKTTFIGMLLELLRKGTHGITAQLGGPSTAAIQKETFNSLTRRRFPDPTANDASQWNWVHCDLDFKGRPDETTNQERKFRQKSGLPLNPGYQWITPDISGESLERELRHPESFPALPCSIEKATGVVLLVDAEKARDPAFPNEDVQALLIAKFVRNNAIASILNASLNDIPMAIVLTKTDRCPEADQNPNLFVESYLPAFAAFLRENFPARWLFASSVVGSVARQSERDGGGYVPLHIQPRNIIDPLAWLLKV